MTPTDTGICYNAAHSIAMLEKSIHSYRSHRVDTLSAENIATGPIGRVSGCMEFKRNCVQFAEHISQQKLHTFIKITWKRVCKYHKSTHSNHNNIGETYWITYTDDKSWFYFATHPVCWQDNAVDCWLWVKNPCWDRFNPRILTLQQPMSPDSHTW